jgi:hypothetical protein
MRKKLALLLALVMICATMLTACGEKSDPDFDGTSWDLTELVTEGMTIDAEQIEATGYSMTFEFKKGGTVTGGNLGEAKWEHDGDTLSITADGETIDCKIDGDKFTLEMEGMKMVFTKQ